MHNPNMLAFTYRLQKIMRDMRHLQLQSEEEETGREAVLQQLQQVCNSIEENFGEQA